MPGKTQENHNVRGEDRSSASGLLPPGSGAYALVIRLDRRFSAPVDRLGAIALPAGDYLYCGSANGPGGLRARIARHLRPAKPAHWHVDRLTGAGRIGAVLAVPGGSECALVQRSLACPGVSVPIPGFGSSDCRACPAHLLAVADDAALLASLAAFEPEWTALRL